MSELLLSLGISLGLTVLIELSLSFLLGIRSRDLLLLNLCSYTIGEVIQYVSMC